MCWAEKVPLFLFVLVAAFLAFLGFGLSGTAGTAYAQQTAYQHFDAYVTILVFLFERWFLPLWIVLRIIDLLLGGPSRRAGRVTARIVR